jgi:hypothetical protein
MSDRVTSRTRAPRDGRVIIAPCGYVVRVYHFAWSALGCSKCGEDHEKHEYRISEEASLVGPAWSAGGSSTS